MDILSSLQQILTPGARNPSAGTGAANNGYGSDLLSSIMGASSLGGLAGALFGGKRSNGINGGVVNSAGGGGLGSIIKGALLAGGGAMLWNKYKDRIRENVSGDPNVRRTVTANSIPEERAERMVRALVYAVKADGHVDEDEKSAIAAEVNKLGLGETANQVVQSAMNEQIDPEKLARGVVDEEEALQIFTVSCAAVNIDSFMERNYLTALAQALHIPDDVRDDMLTKFRQPQPQHAGF